MERRWKWKKWDGKEEQDGNRDKRRQWGIKIILEKYKWRNKMEMLNWAVNRAKNVEKGWTGRKGKKQDGQCVGIRLTGILKKQQRKEKAMWRQWNEEWRGKRGKNGN